MTRDALKTLFHPFDTGDLALPASNASVLFVNAEPGILPLEGFPGAIHCVQGFRPDFLRLKVAHPDVAQFAPEGPFDLALVLAGRHRGANELNLAAALERVAEGGLIVVAGAKDDGIQSLRKRAGAAVEIDGSLSKHHGIAFWFRRPADGGCIAAAFKADNPAVLVDGRFQTAPGMFSFDRVDPASLMLAESLPVDMKGTVADFCAGWGYLAARIAEFAGVKNVDLYEADFASLEAARMNVAGLRPEFGFHWHDLLSEPVTARYDAIVMNPPFHEGRASDPSLGQGMIKAAATALKKGGKLYMVANRRLPYEATLSTHFSDFAEIAGNGAFKVFAARR